MWIFSLFFFFFFQFSSFSGKKKSRSEYESFTISVLDSALAKFKQAVFIASMLHASFGAVDSSYPPRRGVVNG